MRQKSKTTKSNEQGARDKRTKASKSELPTSNSQLRTPKLEELRKRAEAKLKKQEERLEGLSTHGIKKLIHELGTYQIELEMQNEELRRAQHSLEESRSRYADLYDFAPVGYFTLSKNGTVLEANLTGAAMLGINKQELIKKPFSVFIHREDQDTYYLYRKKVFETGVRETCELRLKRKDGSFIWARLQSITVEVIEHKPLQCRTTISDITDRKRAEESLEESRRFTGKIANTTPDIIYVFDIIEHYLVYVNDALARTLGYSREDIQEMGESLYTRLIHPEDISRVFETIALFETKNDEDIVDLDFRVKHSSNGWRWLSTRNIIFSRTGDGLPKEILGVAHDLTERKRTEDALGVSEEQLRLVVRDSPIPVIMHAEDGQVLQISRTWTELTGYSIEDINRFDKWISNAVYGEGADKVRDHMKKLFSSRSSSSRVEFDILTKTGEIRCWSFIASALGILADGRRFIIGMAEDITERKRAETESEKLLQDLTRSNRELEQFAYVASHDLQEPLRMITSYIGLLSDRYKGRFDTDADEFIDYAVNGAAHMKTLLNDMLAYSRVGTHGKPFELTDLNISVKTAINNLKKNIEQSKAEIRQGNLPAVFADGVQMVQVFQNLLDNAIKFCGSTPPDIHIFAEWKQTEWVIGVSDNCIGIDPRHFDRIFLMFKRLHPGDKYPGTGVGLAVCKKIVERHGGHMWVESEPGKGSTFYFTIPVK